MALPLLPLAVLQRPGLRDPVVLGAHSVIAQPTSGGVEHPGGVLTVGQCPGDISESSRVATQPFDDAGAGVGRFHRQGGKFDDPTGDHPVVGGPAAFPCPVSARRRAVPWAPPAPGVGQLGAVLQAHHAGVDRLAVRVAADADLCRCCCKAGISRSGSVLMGIFSGRHYPKDVILWAVRWYCRYGVS